MKDLCGIDDFTLCKDIGRTPAHQQHALNVLRDGTFIDSKVQQKFDLTKTTKCKHCGQEDSLQHRCTECPAYNDVNQRNSEICNAWPSLTKSLKEHLLPNRNPWEANFRRERHYVVHEIEYDLTGMYNNKDLHLFTDGSAHEPGTPEQSLAAWAVISATEEKMVSSSPLDGPNQTNDRAELEGVLHALCIAARLRRPTTIWTDSSMVGQGAEQLLQDADSIPDGKHRAGWKQIQEALLSCENVVRIQHISAHRQSNALNQDFDDWSALWNNRADWEARAAHKKRDPTLQRTWEAMRRHQDEQLQHLRRLRDLHWEVVEVFKHLPETEDYQDQVDHEEDDETEDCISKLWRTRQETEAAPLQEFLEGEGQDTLQDGHLVEKFGADFPRRVFQILKDQTVDEGSRSVKLSWLELTVGIMMR